MGIINKTFVLRIFAYGMLTLCVLGGALTYASTVMASQQSSTLTPEYTGTHSEPSTLKVAYSDTANYQNSYSNIETTSETGKQGNNGFFLPVLTWFLGSAALAMFGYKRMRHPDA